MKKILFVHWKFIGETIGIFRKHADSSPSPHFGDFSLEEFEDNEYYQNAMLDEDEM